MGALARIGAVLRAWSSRPGPASEPANFLPIEGGWVPCAWPLNFGQVGYDPIAGGWDSVVYAAVMLYARTIAQLPGFHKRTLADGGTETITTSALSRILKKPNSYQTRSDFMFNLVVSLLGEGNAYAMALRNDRSEVDSLHLLQPRGVGALVANEGSVFYQISNFSNGVLDKLETEMRIAELNRLVVPASDMLHIRVHCPRDPLLGESPLIAAMLPVAIHSGGSAQFARFAANASRPSGVLRTDKDFTAAQVAELRARWEEQSKGVALGGVPILTGGLNWQPMSFSPVDSQAAESQKLSIADIARIFGVPLALLNDMTGSTFQNTEQLLGMWKAQGLGFYLEHIELNFDKLFGIERAADYSEFDVAALERPDFKSRIEGLARAVQGGVYAPNEARRVEGLAAAEGGDEPRLQAQMVPLSAEPAPAAAPATPVPAPAANDNPPAADDGGAAGDPAPEDAAAAKALAGVRLRKAIAEARHAP